MPGTKESAEFRRAQILDTAFRIALRDGISGLTVRGVAREAGVSMGLVAFYFGNKDDLLLELFRRLNRRLLDAVVATIPSDRSAGDRIVSMIEGTAAVCAERADDVHLILDFWMRARSDEKIRTARRDAADAWLEVTECLTTQAIAEAPHRYADVTPRAFATVIAGILEGSLIRSALDEPSLEPAEIARTIRSIAPAVLPRSARPIASIA